MIECKVLGPKKEKMSSTKVGRYEITKCTWWFFDEIALITDHAYLQLGRFKVMFMPRKYIYLEEKNEPITNIPYILQAFFSF